MCAVKIQRVFRARKQREYSVKLRGRFNDMVCGQKERRRASVFRCGMPVTMFLILCCLLVGFRVLFFFRSGRVSITALSCIEMAGLSMVTIFTIETTPGGRT